jgi:hypothetical protein
MASASSINCAHTEALRGNEWRTVLNVLNYWYSQTINFKTIVNWTLTQTAKQLFSELLDFMERLILRVNLPHQMEAKETSIMFSDHVLDL